MIEIIFKNRDLVLISKKAGVPSQKDRSADADAMSLTSDALRGQKENDSLWLIHRLDRVVGGLLVFARNKKSASLLSRLVAEGKIEKRYLAVVEGDAEGGVMRDYIYKDSMSSKAYICNKERRGVKLAELEYTALEKIEMQGKIYTLVYINLISGRFHQIRAQFSHRKMPLVGDKKYGSRDLSQKMPALFAARLSFEIDGRMYTFSKFPSREEYPWNMFSPEIFESEILK